MSTQNALKLLFELRVVLDRLAENDSSLHEAVARDVEEATRLAEGCISELAQDAGNQDDDEEDED